MVITGPHHGKSSVCTPILLSLPEWFGIEEALVQYSQDIDVLPTFLAYEADQIFGFLTVKEHNPYSAEIYVMGVLPEMQRKGMGRLLMQASQEWLISRSVEYLQVKTLGPSNDDPSYAKTRAFYFSMGFRPLEELKQIWDENNPCLLMVKKLSPQDRSVLK